MSDLPHSEAGPGPELISSRGLRDWRIWFGVIVTVGCFWYAMRGVPFAEVRDAMGRADLLALVAISVPAYVLSVVSRAYRWGHLTDAILPIPRASLFRAQSIGFMVNNLVPLRVGELVRTFYLARDNRTSATAILGTVVLERVLDVTTVLFIAVGSLAYLGLGSEDGGILSQGAILMAPVAIVPVAGLVALRVAPEATIGALRWFARPLPERVGTFLAESLRKFAAGLGALSGGAHLFWILVHSIFIWLVCSTVPLAVGLYAFGLDLGTPADTVVISWILLAAVGVAVAIPSAPGFFGTYQLAFKAVLDRFGVDPAVSLAMGLLVWLVFWLTLTLQGLLVLRLQRTSLFELARRRR